MSAIIDFEQNKDIIDIYYYRHFLKLLTSSKNSE